MPKIHLMKVSQLTRILLNNIWLLAGDFDEMTLTQLISLIRDDEIHADYKKNQSWLVNPDGEFREGLDSPQSDDVAVLSLNDVLDRHDDLSNTSTETFASQLKSAFDDNRIGSVVVKSDTPGGSYSSLIPIKEAFQKKNKPVLGLIDDQGESAGYFALANTDEIYASDPFAKAGSIGVMSELINSDEKLENEGIKIHRVFPDESPDKNDVVMKAREGDYSLLKQELSKIAQHFQNHVKAQRPNVSADALTGKSYYAKEAQDMGLIDGLSSLEQTIERARQLSAKNQILNQLQ